MIPLSLTSIVSELKQRQNKVREGYNDNDFDNDFDKDEKNAFKLAGLGTAVLLVILVISLILYVWALVILIKYWNALPEWAKIVGILGLIPAIPLGPLVTIIVVYIGKDAGSKKK